MFALPLETLLLVFGAPAVWIAYTIGFLWLSRHWPGDPVEPGEE